MGPAILALAQQAIKSRRVGSQRPLYFKLGHGGQDMVDMDPGRNKSMERNMGEKIWNAMIDRRKAKSPGKHRGINHMEFTIRK